MPSILRQHNNERSQSYLSLYLLDEEFCCVFRALAHRQKVLPSKHQVKVNKTETNKMAGVTVQGGPAEPWPNHFLQSNKKSFIISILQSQTGFDQDKYEIWVSTNLRNQ